MTSRADDPDTLSEQTMIVRLPIFTRSKDVWGYEFLLSDPGAASGEEAPTLSGLVRFYQDHVARMPSPLAEKKLLLTLPDSVDLTADFRDEDGPMCAFFLNVDRAAHPDSVALAEKLHQKGGALVVEESLEPCVRERLDHGCIIRVSLADKTPPEIVNIRKKFKGTNSEFLAVDVDSWEAFEGTRALGFSYFQGPFFSVPQVREGVNLPASAVAKLQLLRELGNPDCEMDDLASIIATDVSLSYRILRYMNSAALGMRNKVRSIGQAVSLLGLNEVRHWALVVVMTDIDSTPRGEELSYLALQRGRFLSQLAESMESVAHPPETMFLLGLFSKLDALLDCPMDRALEDIPLDDGIKEALCGTLNDFRDWLLLLDAVEIGNWEVANDILGRYGACLTSAATHYMRAASWAARLLPELSH
ncbi:HDOD domain-containing protein [Pseudodesulfovibrio sp.]|uniref:EAL and HDOD domain-containing protein n=1 Tax=Pseudodesulfovibrio sp. TaxID=2035812 RepID=UPI002630D408|nr:HDOD domain-containing protein [Pseudodesulfovibrio sp.]MDD3310893.1 HDOD domain-containing protein [Pseudodesulfovibrio sp.]